MSVKAYFTQEETETWYTANSIRRFDSNGKNDSQVPTLWCLLLIMTRVVFHGMTWLQSVDVMISANNSVCLSICLSHC